MDLLLLSTTTAAGQAPLETASPAVADFVGGRRVLFVPYAVRDHDQYSGWARDLLAPFGATVTGMHTVDPLAAVSEAEVIFVGGGNSFRLLDALQRSGLISAIRRRVLAGGRYMGSSAGSNMACPTLRTTNDMPIVQPASFAALGLVPFQINPHYPLPDTAVGPGETRDQRLAEFLEENDVPVIGLREPAWIRRQGDTITLDGTAGARLFQRGQNPIDIGPQADLSHLGPGRFDR